MKPLALDLYCGIWEGGWANGLVKAGWDVIGVDIEDQGGYVGHKILADVREIAKDVEAYFPALKFDLVVASPPCQEFSYRDLPFGRVKNLPPPDLSLFEAAVKIASDLKCPLVLENVRGAQRFVGRANAKWGSIYLWGDVPAILPYGGHKKGFGDLGRPGKPIHEGRQFCSSSKERKRWSAKVAMIPEELSTWIGQVFYPQYEAIAGPKGRHE